MRRQNRRVSAPGHRLRRLRESARVSVRALGQKTGISHNTIIAWERDPYRLRPDNPEHVKAVELMAEALGVAPDAVWASPRLSVEEHRAAYQVQLDTAYVLLEAALNPESSEETRERAKRALEALLTKDN